MRTYHDGSEEAGVVLAVVRRGLEDRRPNRGRGRLARSRVRDREPRIPRRLLAVLMVVVVVVAVMMMMMVTAAVLLMMMLVVAVRHGRRHRRHRDRGMMVVAVHHGRRRIRHGGMMVAVRHLVGAGGIDAGSRVDHRPIVDGKCVRTVDWL